MTEREIFIAALQIKEPIQRQAYLDEACFGQPELRQQVENLLGLHAGAGSFLEQPAAESAAPATLDQPVPERPGTQIGPYKLLQQIGEGGMGIVWMAEQTQPVQRKVALKFIKPGMDSRQVIARFEAERQALALMDHPNIARVLDAGATASGRPYFVMELVRGVPITQYCDDNRLSPRERLELFTHVCQAVQHAHHKGIIHRDIKPNNVLVTSHDGRPVVKVIDFGVAKAVGQQLTDKTIYTNLSQMVGTPLYMSPEQAGMSGLDIDTRTDIYSLGVLLYELLTGTTPFDKERLKRAAYDEMRRIIREEEPQKPSTRISTTDGAPSIAACRHTEPSKLARLVRGDLDWIVMKALEKDRSRRYETANGFAADVLHYLADEPVLACPPSLAYQLRKFARRNKGPVIAASLIVLALVGGMIGTTIGLFRAEEQRQIADAQKKKAEQAEADTLADYRASTDDAIEQLIGSKPDLGPQERAYLEKTLKRWQAFAARQGDDERSQAIRAEGHHRVAILWTKLGQRDAARTEYETARDLYKKLADDFPAVPAYRHELTRTRINLGMLLFELNERGAARTEMEAARDVQQKLVASFPTVPEYQQKLAVAHNSLGTLLRELGQREAARTEYETAHDLRKKLADAFPAVAEYQQDLARTHYNLGILLAGLGQRDAARKEYQTARDLRKKLADAFPAVSGYQGELANIHIRLGHLLFELGQRDAARTEYQSARDLRKKLADAFPAVPGYQQELATTHNNLGNALVSLGQREAARAEYEMARDLQKKLADAFPAVPGYQQELATNHNNLGILLAGLGQRHSARTEYETARDLQRKLVDAFPTVPAYQQVLARTHNNLGILLKDLGQRDAARAEVETARDLKKKLADAFPDVPVYQVELGGSYYDLGNLVRDAGQPADSLRWYDLAIRTLTPVYEKDPRDARARQFLRDIHANRAIVYGQLKRDAEEVQDLHKVLEVEPQDADAHCNLGIAFYGQGKFQKAIAAHQEAIKRNPEHFPAYGNLALALVKLGDPMKLPEAIAAAEKAIALDPKNANAHNTLGLALGDQKMRDQAITAFRKAIELDPKLPNAHSNLATALARQGKYDEAIEHCRKAIEINPKNVSAYDTLGICLRDRRRLDEAIDCYSKAIERDPNNARLQFGLGNALSDQGKLPEAIAAFRKAIELDPEFHAAHYELAWRLTVCSDLNLRDPEQALVSARRTVELAPMNRMYWQGLGYAEYRSGNWNAAVQAFQKVKQLGSAGDSLEWFPLSMAYWQLGDTAAARKTCDQAVQWMEKHSPKDVFLRGLQAEAAELMGIDQKKE